MSVLISVGKEITILDPGSFGVVLGENLVEILNRWLGGKVCDYLAEEYEWIIENCFVKEDCIVAQVECRYENGSYCHHYYCTEHRYDDRDDMEGIELDYKLNYVTSQTIDSEDRILYSIAYYLQNKC